MPPDLPFTDDIAYRFDSLYQWLSRKYTLEQVEKNIAGRTFQFFKIADINAVIEQVLETSPNPDENVPYWAEIWPSALALGQFILREKILTGGKILELGCGLGIVGITAFRQSSAEVVLSDINEDALRLSELNWIINFQSSPALMLLDWRNPPADQKFKTILAADVAYERRLFLPLLNTFEQLLAPGGEIWLSEPNRSAAKVFFEMLSQAQFEYKKWDESVILDGKETIASIYKIRKR
jgi:predicted nicotinamide N-methyase